MTEIDQLQIKIEAEASKANSAIDTLATKLDTLYNSLGRINGASVSSFASSVTQLSSAVQGVASIDGRTFSALARNIDKIASINSANLMSSAYSVSSFAQAFNNLGNVSNGTKNIGALASNISKLGGKNVQVAIANLPQLAQALKQVMTVLSTSPKVTNNLIKMTNALANLASQGAKVKTASNAMVNGLERTNVAAQRTSKSAMSLARAFGKFYANYFLLVRGFKALYGSMQSAMELTETVNYFEVTLRNIGENAKSDWEKYGYESADAYAETFAQRLKQSTEKLTGFAVSDTGKVTKSQFAGLGISPAMATQYSAMFAQVANSIGMTEEASVALSEAFVRLGADWASLRNVDFDVAYEKLASGLSGQSRALRAFGIDITMATLQETAFRNGITKSVSEMTQAEKSYLRLIAIIEQSEVAFGDLANTLQSPANQIRMLEQGVENLATLTGNLFIPILSKALPVLNGFVIALQRIVIAVSESMGIDTSGFNTSLGGMTDEFGGLTDGIEDTTEAAEAFNKATRGWDELNILGSKNDKGYGVGNDIVENAELNKAFFASIEKYRKAWSDAYDNIENNAEDFADKLLVGIDLKKVGSSVSDFADAVKELSEALLPFASGAITGFASANAKMLDTILYFFGGLLEDVDPDDAKAVGEAIGKIASQLLLFKGVTSAYTGIQKAVNGISAIGSVLKANPILLTVGIGGVVATNLAGILTDYTKEAFSYEYVEGLEDFTAEIEEETEAFKERADAAKKASEMPSELEAVYERWREIAEKVGELSDEESGLLVQYSNRIKELLPESAELIGANGKAYEGAAEQLDALISKQLELYRIQSAETHVKDIMQIEIEMEYNLKDKEKERNELFKEIVQTLAPDFDEKTHPLYGMLPEVQFQNEVLEDIKDAYLRRLTNIETNVFNLDALTKARSEYENAVKNIEKYQEAQKNISEQESAYKDVQNQLTEAIKGLTDAQKEYNTTSAETEEAIEYQVIDVGEFRIELDNTVSSMYDVTKETKEATKKVDLFAKSAINATETFEKLKKTIEELSSTNLTLPNVSSFEEIYKKSSGSALSTHLNPYNIGGTNYSFEDSVKNAVISILPQQQNNVNVTFDVQGDPNGLFKVVQNQASVYSKSTGMSAFK